VWNGIMVPAGTPAQIIDRLQGEIAHILAQPDTRAKLAALGFDPVASKPAEFGEYLRAEAQRSARVVHEAGIQVQ
jgi:tripartite-type tricarboxylate transporter receptor subunit TctC